MRTELKLKARTFQDQAGICYYCQKLIPLHRWTMDHRIPISRGGKGIHGNKVGCCNTCNHKKGNMTEEEFKQCKTRAEMKRKLNEIQKQIVNKPKPIVGTYGSSFGGWYHD